MIIALSSASWEAGYLLKLQSAFVLLFGYSGALSPIPDRILTFPSFVTSCWWFGCFKAIMSDRSWPRWSTFRGHFFSDCNRRTSEAWSGPGSRSDGPGERCPMMTQESQPLQQQQHSSSGTSNDDATGDGDDRGCGDHDYNSWWWWP